MSNVDPWAPDAFAFYRKRGLSHSTVTRFRLGRVVAGRYAGRLDIPYIDGQERVRGHRYRALDDREPKYLSPAGQQAHLFAIRASDEEIGVICEGELDAITAWQCSVKAVGVPGAAVWRDEWAYVFRNCTRIVIAFDSDDAGQRGAHRVGRSFRRVGIDVEVASLPEGRDLNDILVQDGCEAVKEVLRA